MRNSLFLSFLIMVTAISSQKETLLSPDSDGDVQCDGKDRDDPQQTKTTLTYTDGKIKSRWTAGSQNTDFPMANLTSIVKLKLTLPKPFTIDWD